MEYKVLNNVGWAFCDASQVSGVGNRTWTPTTRQRRVFSSQRPSSFHHGCSSSLRHLRPSTQPFETVVWQGQATAEGNQLWPSGHREDLHQSSTSTNPLPSTKSRRRGPFAIIWLREDRRVEG